MDKKKEKNTNSSRGIWLEIIAKYRKNECFSFHFRLGNKQCHSHKKGRRRMHTLSSDGRDFLKKSKIGFSKKIIFS